MGYTPAFDTLHAPEAIADSANLSRSADMRRGAREILRFGGLAMDSMTGATSWRGKLVTLSVQEREVLGVLMRRAGQIIKRERLATMLGTTHDVADQAVKDLRETLKSAGSTCLPYEVDGLGYILWRS
jgi:DNA-binding response OmpR family regulator